MSFTRTVTWQTQLLVPVPPYRHCHKHQSLRAHTRLVVESIDWAPKRAVNMFAFVPVLEITSINHRIDCVAISKIVARLDFQYHRLPLPPFVIIYLPFV